MHHLDPKHSQWSPAGHKSYTGNGGVTCGSLELPELEVAASLPERGWIGAPDALPE